MRDGVLGAAARRKPRLAHGIQIHIVCQAGDDRQRRIVVGGHIAEQIGGCARVRAAIEQLPRKQRATLILRTYHEMSHQEIAEVLGSSVGAVKANFFHALGNLKKLLSEEPQGSD